MIAARAAREARLRGARDGHARGWSYTPLRGKRPILDAWPTRARESLSEAERWARQGNVGVRTGRASGLVVVDVDLAKGAVVPAEVEAAPTWTARTGGGGLHAYYALPEGVDVGCPTTLFGRDSHVEIKGDGGQVVAVGSIHPETGRMYDWDAGRGPSDLPLAVLPPEIVALVATHRARQAPTPFHSKPIPAGRGTTYGRAALLRAAGGVAETAPGSRNAALNATAYSLARLVEAGHLAREDVEAALLEAAAKNHYTDAEGERAVRRVITSGIEAGLAAGPRGPSLPWATSRSRP